MQADFNTNFKDKDKEQKLIYHQCIENSDIQKKIHQ